MAEIAWPGVTVSDFRLGVDDRGRVVYPAAYTAADFIVKSGATRLAGNVTFAPATFAEDAALQGFILELDGDSDDYVMVPIFRDQHRSGEGVFGAGTTFAVTSVADSGDDATAIAFGYTVTDRAMLAQTELHVGSVMSLNGTLVRFTTVNHTPPSTGVAGTVSGVVKPQVESASPNVLTEAVVKAQFRGAGALLARTSKRGLDPLTISFYQVP